jgi:hypothetical protein
MALANKMTGRFGEIRIDALGALVGSFSSWTLARREEGGSHGGPYDLHADCSYLNPYLWDDPDYPKTITVQIGRDRRYRLEQDPGTVRELTGRQLILKGVRLCPME